MWRHSPRHRRSSRSEKLSTHSLVFYNTYLLYGITQHNFRMCKMPLPWFLSSYRHSNDASSALNAITHPQANNIFRFTILSSHSLASDSFSTHLLPFKRRRRKRSYLVTWKFNLKGVDSIIKRQTWTTSLQKKEITFNLK